MRFPKPYADMAARLRVPSGFLLAVVLVWLSQPTLRSVFWGLPVSLVGLWLRGWAAGHLEKNIALAQSGPYAWMRNPLYVGTLITALGLALASKRPLVALIFWAVFSFVYLPVIELEEQHLRKIFPGFAEYEAKVPMLIPRIPENPPQREYAWRLYMKNEEYKAAIALACGLAFLFWKAAT